MWPEAALLGPVYPFAPETGLARPFMSQYDTAFEQNYAHCMVTPDDRSCPRQDTMHEINRVCLQMKQCKYDYFETKQSQLAVQVKQEWNVYKEAKTIGTQRCKWFGIRNAHSGISKWASLSDNSCGAINIEYPEYLVIDPPTGKLYLEGDTVHFDCYQEHWVKGQSFFKCLRGGWTKGYQPWCRCKPSIVRLAVYSTHSTLLYFSQTTGEYAKNFGDRFWNSMLRPGSPGCLHVLLLR